MLREAECIVLFGPPGVGKTTVSEALVKEGYFHFDGDKYSLPEAVALNREGKGLTPELRDREYEHIFRELRGALGLYPLVVFDYHLMWDRYRLMLRSMIPDLRWVYLTATLDMIADRLERPDHILDKHFAAEVFRMFEEPSFLVERIDATLPLKEIVRQVLAK